MCVIVLCKKCVGDASSILRWAAVSVALLVTAFCSAQPQEPYGTNWEYARQYKYQVSVAPFTAASTKVSGTKVDFTVTSSFPGRSDQEPYYGTELWQNAKILWMKGYINDTLVGTWTPREEPPLGSSPKTIRFASTHFEDDSTVTLKVRAKFRFWNIEPAEEYENEIEVAVDVNVHNKAQVVATQQDIDPKTGQFVDGRNLGLYADTSKEAASAAVPAIQGMKHTVFVSSGLDSQQKSDLLSRYPNQTLLFDFTHGSPNWFTDSFTNLISFTGSPNDVAANTGNRTDEPAAGLVPHHNLVIMYACSTLSASGNGSWAAPISFGVVSAPWVNKTNRAYVGFTGLIWYGGQNERNSLKKHAAVFLQLLGNGSTIKEALGEANKVVSVRGQDMRAIKMVVKGDEFTRIVDAYTGSEVNKSWFYVLD